MEDEIKKDEVVETPEAAMPEVPAEGETPAEEPRKLEVKSEEEEGDVA